MGRLRFMDIQQKVYRLRKEHNEVVRVVVECWEDLAKCQNELKETNEMVRCHDDSILNTEKEMEHFEIERDKVGAELEKT